MKSVIENMHALAIPVNDKHSGEFMFETVQTLLFGLFGEEWKTKMISVASDGARNVTGRYQGAVTRFEIVCFPEIYRIWCAAYQLDLVIQSLMSGVIKREFRDPLVAIIAYFCRQLSLRNEMDTTCPIVSTTRCLSLGSSTRWLVRYRERVSHYMDERAASAKPSAEWWVFIVAVKSFMAAVDECFKAIQGRDATITEQNQHLATLCGEVRTMGGIMGPLSGMDMLSVAEQLNIVASQSSGEETYAVPRKAVVELLVDSSLSTVNDLNSLDGNVQDHVICTVAEMLLSAYLQLWSLQTKRATNNSPSLHVVPPVFPAQIYSLRPRELFDIIPPQADRRMATCSADYIVILENEFRLFKRYVARRPFGATRVAKI